MSAKPEAPPEARFVAVLAPGLLALSAPVLAVELADGRWVNAGLTLLFAALMALVWTLNRRGLLLATLALLLGGGGGVACLSALATAPREHGSLALVTVAVAAVALVPVNAPLIRWGIAALATALSVAVEFGRTLSPISAEAVGTQGWTHVLVNVVGSSAVVLGIMNFRSRAYHRSLQRLDRVRGELQRQQRLQIRSSRNSALGEVSAGIAHEVNNPLSVVLLSTERGRTLLEADPPDVDAAKVEAVRVASTARRVGRIVRSLVRVSKQSRREGPVPVELAGLVSDTLNLCKERFTREGVVVDVSVPEDFQVRANETELSQVLLNLLLNAFDAARASDEPWVKLQARAEGGRATLDVTDGGAGVPDDVLPKLMEPFFTTKPHGTGLGLSLSLGLTEAMGGTLEHVPDAPHTCFRVTLPLADR